MAHFRLSAHMLHHYLIDKGLVDPRSIMDGSYIVTQSLARNLVFMVRQGHGRPLFVKQIQNFDHQNTYLLQKDATTLWLITNAPSYKKLSNFVPAYFGYDTEAQALFTELIPDAQDMETYITREGKLPVTLMKLLGEALASFHFPIPEEVAQLPAMKFYRHQLPWAFKMRETAAAGAPFYGTASNPPTPVATVLSSHPQFIELLSGVKEMYEFRSLIHGDIKWMNILVQSSQGNESIKLIDWEISDVGDPLWDVAGVIQSIVTAALTDHPLKAKDYSNYNPERPLEMIGDAWSSMAQFWAAYTSHRQEHDRDDAADLLKAVHFAAVRLLQTAVEHNGHQAHLSHHANRLLQASYAILLDPAVVARRIQPAPTAIPA